MAKLKLQICWKAVLVTTFKLKFWRALAMRIVVQNLQKKPHLATDLVQEYMPDVMLAQEINLSTEDEHLFPVHFTSKRGYGTAIYSESGSHLVNVHRVQSPHAEIGGFIYKKTTVADFMGVQLVSFHGYNGQPIKNISKLVDHIKAVKSVLSPSGPAIFAGDFNTWTRAHLDAAKVELENANFRLAHSWPYPGRDFPLDHVFVRGLRVDEFSLFSSKADHYGALLEIEISDHEL